MKSPTVRSSFILSATLSNYVALLIRIGCMLVLTRLLFQQLSADAYGFWALLWALFGYSVLLDFGLGVATQKFTSEVMVRQDWESYNRRLSSIVTLYSLLALLLATAILWGGESLVAVFQIQDTAPLADYGDALVYFGVGTALSFPTGIFLEVLRGAHCIHLRNLIQIGRELLNTLLMAVVLLNEPRMSALAIVAVGTQLLANGVMAWAAHRHLPQLRIRFCWPARAELTQLMSFSLFAYLIMLTNLMILRSDQIILSALGTVAMAGLFNIGAKLADLFRQLTTQFHDVLGPMAARLHASGNQKALASMTLVSSRWIAIIATAGVVPLVLETDRLLQLWLNLTDTTTVTCARLLIVSTWVLVVLRNTSVQVLLMCGQQRTLAAIAGLEAVCNIGLSIVLLPAYGMTGVALGTLIPNLLCALFFSVPMTCRFAGVGVVDFCRQTLALPLTVGMLSAACGLLVRTAFPAVTAGAMLISCLCMGITCLALSWRLLLTREERLQSSQALPGRLVTSRYT